MQIACAEQQRILAPQSTPRARDHRHPPMEVQLIHFPQPALVYVVRRQRIVPIRALRCMRRL
jgi:hypothetical protein